MLILTGAGANPGLILFAATGVALSTSVREHLTGGAAREATQASGWTTPPAEADWTSCRIEECEWDVLRLLVPSRRARTVAVVSLLFDKKTPQVGRHASELLDILRPMIDNSLRQWQRTRMQSRASGALQGALNAVDLGILLIDRLGRISFANQSGLEILNAGLHLRRNGESFTANDLHQALALQVALSHTIASNVDTNPERARQRRAPLFSIRTEGATGPLVLSIVPAPERAVEPQDCAVIVYILDPRLDNSRQLEPVCKLYGLSPVETRLVSLLTAGQSLHEAAASMRIKEQTARGYLKQIFMKTDTNRQADLVRIMLCSLVRIQRGIESAVLETGLVALRH